MILFFLIIIISVIFFAVNVHLSLGKIVKYIERDR